MMMKFFFFLSLLCFLKGQEIPNNVEVYFTNLNIPVDSPDSLLVWTVQDASLEDGASLVLAKYTGAPNQKFLISIDSERWFHIRAVHSAKDIAVDSDPNGVRVYQYTPSTAPPGSQAYMAQQFTINIRQLGESDPDYCLGARVNNRWLQADTVFDYDLGQWSLVTSNVVENEPTFGDSQKWKIRLA